MEYSINQPAPGPFSYEGEGEELVSRVSNRMNEAADVTLGNFAANMERLLSEATASLQDRISGILTEAIKSASASVSSQETAKAKAAVEAAASAANRAAVFANDAQASAQALVSGNVSVNDYVAQAEWFANEATAQAQAAHAQAKSAWRMAVAATVHNSRPGIAILNSSDQLDSLATGLFIINPNVTNSPTPFMGIWPVRATQDMLWDGIFFIAEPYPDAPVMPPAQPLPPDINLPDPNAAGNAASWIGDGHYHTLA